MNFIYLFLLKRLFVVLNKEIHVFAFPHPIQLEMTVQTAYNPKGLFQVTPTVDKDIVFYPSHPADKCVGTVKVQVNVYVCLTVLYRSVVFIPVFCTDQWSLSQCTVQISSVYPRVLYRYVTPVMCTLMYYTDVLSQSNVQSVSCVISIHFVGSFSITYNQLIHNSRPSAQFGSHSNQL